MNLPEKILKIKRTLAFDEVKVALGMGEPMSWNEYYRLTALKAKLEHQLAELK